MSRIKAILHPVKKEFSTKKCGFDHTPADDFVKSQWQNCSKSNAYLIYRWFIAIFFIGVVLESMINQEDQGSFWLYFIYMTNWGIILCMLTNLLGAILVTTWHYHPEYADKLLNMESLTSPFRVYWSMHIISLVASIIITIIYWTVLYNAEQSSLSVTNVLTHAFNSICMFVDLLIVAHPLRLLHLFLPVLFGIVYAIFSYIYQMLGGINRKGKPYIYHVIDWSRPKNAFLTVVVILTLCIIVYMILFTIYKLRTLLYKRLNSSIYKLPTNVKCTGKSVKNTNIGESGTGIQHSPSGISMVLSNFSGCENPAYTVSSENIKHKI
ncbi:protein rolling stone [Teleopsis dalmanni]|uniref:protein rolling stone n=1 Tax=Teleopsis dalmanni TaxID=139649 RepID=UPI0018CCADCA|nr:protein rolling stone [Teleopsis dalmanni]